MRSRSVLPLLSSFFLTCAIAAAQLNGTYTIDSSLPAGSGNYTTFAAAVTDLTTLGVSGPVTFVVYPGVGAYTGFALATPVTGASAANNITFVAAPSTAPLVSGLAAGVVQTIRLGGTTTTANAGPSFVTIQGLTVTAAAAGSGIIIVGCNSCQVLNCTVYGTVTPALASGNGIQIVNSNNCRIADCEVYNTGGTPGTPGSNAYSGGVGVYYGPSSGNVLERNRVHDVYGQGVFVGTSGNTTMPSTVTVVNNMIWNCPGTGTYVGGIALRRTPGLICANNSVLMPAGTVQPGIHQMTADGIPTVMANNMVRHDGTGACFRLESTTAGVPTLFDYNAYEPGPSAFVGQVATATNYATLAAWQAVTAPNMAGKEANTAVGSVAYLTGTDLHITAASIGFNNGTPVAAVTVDIDGQVRNAGTPCRGADETTGVGLFPSFSASPTTGAAALTVNFTDTTYTSDPGGVTSWAWDFENDGIVDSTVQNPSHTYLIPGTYSVRLSVTDASNPANFLLRSNLVTVNPYDLVVTTTGGGVGDLTISPIPPQYQNPTAATGFLLISFATTQPVNTGPFLHLIPDATTFGILTAPATVGDILHWVVTPGLFPTVPLSFPAGSLTVLTGVSVDFVQVDLSPTQSLLSLSSARRVTF